MPEQEKKKTKEEEEVSPTGRRQREAEMSEKKPRGELEIVQTESSPSRVREGKSEILEEGSR